MLMDYLVRWSSFPIVCSEQEKIIEIWSLIDYSNRIRDNFPLSGASETDEEKANELKEWNQSEEIVKIPLS